MLVLAHCDSDDAARSPPASGSGAPVRETVEAVRRHREGMPMGAVRAHHEDPADPAAASSHRPSFESDLLAVRGEDGSEAWGAEAVQVGPVRSHDLDASALTTPEPGDD